MDAFEGARAIFDQDIPSGGAVFDAVEAEGEIAFDIAFDMGGFVALAAGIPGEDAEVIEVVIDVAGGEGGPEPDGFEISGAGGDVTEGVVGGDAGAFGVLGDFFGDSEVEEGGEDPAGAAIGGADEGPGFESGSGGGRRGWPGLRGRRRGGVRGGGAVGEGDPVFGQGGGGRRRGRGGVGFFFGFTGASGGGGGAKEVLEEAWRVEGDAGGALVGDDGGADVGGELEEAGGLAIGGGVDVEEVEDGGGALGGLLSGACGELAEFVHFVGTEELGGVEPAFGAVIGADAEEAAAAADDFDAVAVFELGDGFGAGDEGGAELEACGTDEGFTEGGGAIGLGGAGAEQECGGGREEGSGEGRAGHRPLRGGGPVRRNREGERGWRRTSPADSGRSQQSPAR
jgi:hypothetical protein